MVLAIRVLREHRTQPHSATNLPSPSVQNRRAGPNAGDILTDRTLVGQMWTWTKHRAGAQCFPGPCWALGQKTLQDSMGKQMGTLKWAVWHRRPRQGRLAGTRQASPMVSLGSREPSAGLGAQAPNLKTPLYPPLLGLSFQE